jgi:hypothetical protein
MNPIFRIKADWARSPIALQSHEGLAIVDLPPIKIDSTDQKAREGAAAAVHLSVMRRFLSTDASHCVVLEDDAILKNDRAWLTWTDYDFFVPFAHNRIHLPEDSTVVVGKLPRYGAFAYLCSRQFAQRYSALLEQGGLADVLSHEAAKGLRFGSFVGNAVDHDNDAPSLVSEERRIAFLNKYPDQKKRKGWFKLPWRNV